MAKTKISKSTLMRTRNHGLPLIKPYLKKNMNNVKRWKIKQTSPIEISKRHLKRVIEEIKDEPKQKVGLAKLGSAGEATLSVCTHPSLELLTFSHPSILAHNVNTLLHQLRKSLLSHDWNSCSYLLQILISSKMINKRFLVYIIRCSLILLLNHCKHSEVLEEFSAVTLGMNDETKMNRFISSLFSFSDDITLKRAKL